MATKPNTPPTLPPNLKASLDDHLSQLRDQIADRADQIANAPIGGASATTASPVDLPSLAKAIDESIKGEASLPDSKPRFFDLFPPFTCVCAVLCLAFATLGLLPLFADPAVATKAAPLATGFLDIAKIFAGAIVGSTTSIALASSKSKRER